MDHPSLTLPEAWPTAEAGVKAAAHPEVPPDGLVEQIVATVDPHVLLMDFQGDTDEAVARAVTRFNFFPQDVEYLEQAMASIENLAKEKGRHRSSAPQAVSEDICPVCQQNGFWLWGKTACCGTWIHKMWHITFQLSTEGAQGHCPICRQKDLK